MFDDLSDLYQEVILDHSKSPRNFRRIEHANYTAKGYNPLCGDEVMLYLVVDDAGTIREIAFEGSGCAISKASASLLTSALQGKSKEEVKEIFDKVHEMVTTGKADQEGLGKLTVFAGVHKFPSRVKCAILPWHAAVAAVDGEKTEVSTE